MSKILAVSSAAPLYDLTITNYPGIVIAAIAALIVCAIYYFFLREYSFGKEASKMKYHIFIFLLIFWGSSSVNLLVEAFTAHDKHEIITQQATAVVKEKVKEKYGLEIIDENIFEKGIVKDKTYFKDLTGKASVGELKIPEDRSDVTVVLHNGGVLKAEAPQKSK